MNIMIDHGCFGYGKSHNILSDINFSAESGDLVAILGPNGAGKTTLLRCMMGFLKWRSGESCIDSENIRSISSKLLWQKIAYVPQSRGVVSGFTVMEMILLGRSSRIGAFSSPGTDDFRKAEGIMNELRISALSDKKCTELSGGELQMVLIARALAAEPEILVLDEPESNLDFKNQLIVLDTLSRLASSGIICIFNTHYPAHALQRANKAFLLSQDGKYIFGDTSAVVTEENIERAFGVRAVIGEIETPGNIFRNVVPLSVSNDSGSMKIKSGLTERKIAALTILTDNFSVADRINEQLHTYSQYIIGRMGMPYRECGIYIINATFDAPQSKIEELSTDLNVLPGVSVKVTFAKGEFEEKSDEQ